MQGNISLAIRALVLAAALLPLTAQETPRPPSLKLWYSSVAAIGVGHALDYASSVALNGNPHVRESNGLLATGDGRFAGGRALVIKSGLSAGLLIPEYVLIRKYPKLARPLSFVNFGFAAIPATAALHNFGLKSKRR